MDASLMKQLKEFEVENLSFNTEEHLKAEIVQETFGKKW